MPTYLPAIRLSFCVEARGHDLSILAPIDVLHHVAARRANEHQQLVHVFGADEADAPLLKNIEHLKFEALMH